MQINKINNISFSAQIDGDIKAIKDMALQNGLPVNLYKKTIAKMQNYFPEKDITIKLYNRTLKVHCTRDSIYPTILQKVKIIKNHEVLDEMLIQPNGKYGVAKYLSAVKVLAEKLKK